MEVQVSASSSRLIDLLGQQSIIDLESLMLRTNTFYSSLNRFYSGKLGFRLKSKRIEKKIIVFFRLTSKIIS